MKKVVFILGLLFCPALNLRAATSQDYFNAGLQLTKQAQYDRAIQYLQAAVQTGPQNWQAYQVLSQDYYLLNKYDDALKACDLSLQIHPDNAPLKQFRETIKTKAGTSSSPAVPPPPSMAANVPQDKQDLDQFNQALDMMKKSRESLKRYGEAHPLSDDEEYIARYGAPKKSFYESHFNLDIGIINPTLVNWDIGFFLDPTTNVGASFSYFPLPQVYDTGIYDSSTGTYYYSYINIPGDLVYFEPRIKFYSAPSGFTSYHGFSFIYWGLHQGTDPNGYINPNADVFALSYDFGFRTLPMDGMTMEFGWKLGVAAAIVTREVYTEYYNGSYYTSSSAPGQITVPFPFIYPIPEFRFGFTF